MKSFLGFAKKKNSSFYLLHIFFFEIARTLPHAILAIFLINKFQTDGSIVLGLQIIFYIGIFLFEIPSGFLSDIFSRKKIFLVSIFLMLIAFPLIGFSDFLWLVFVGQLIYGISDALSSGTIDISILEKYDDAQKVKDFLSKKRMVFFAAAIIGGGIGPLLFQSISNFLYLISTIIFFISFIIGLLVIVDEKRMEKSTFKTFSKELKKNIKLNFSYFKQKNYCLLFISILAPIFIFGPFFNYWPIFYKDNGLDSKFFGIVYIVFQSIGLVCSYVNKKMPVKKIFVILSAIISSLIFVITLFFLKGNAFIYILPLFLFFSNYYNFELNNIFYKQLKKETSSSQVSILSTIASLFSFIIYIILFIFSTQINIYIASIAGAFLFLIVGLITSIFAKFDWKN